MTRGKTRYVARKTTSGRFEVYAIYDRERASWPALLAKVGKVPQSFPSLEDAQAWADEHLNGRTEG